MRTLERLIVKFNGVTTGYDLTTPERRRYELRTPQDWAEFRMSSVTRALGGLSLRPDKALPVKTESEKQKRKAKRKKKVRKNKRKGSTRPCSCTLHCNAE